MGLSNEGKRLPANQLAEKKKDAFWEVANEDVIFVPDINAET
jgi:hypothetical protein